MARKNYTEEQKRKKVEQFNTYLADGMSKAKAAHKVGVARISLRGWEAKQSGTKVVFHSPTKRTYKKKATQQTTQTEQNKVAVIICSPMDVAQIIGGL